MKFVDKIISNKGHLIHKIKGIDERGLQAYYFVLVEPHNEKKFMSAITEGDLNLEDYGKVIASCYGDEPDDETKQLLKDKYGFDV